MSEHKSETSRYRHLTERYCSGCGVDIGSQGDPVVPWAISFDLPEREFARYSSGFKPANPIQLSGDARSLPFNDDSLDFVYSSHLLEDFADWMPVLTEWVRPLKPGGNLVVLIPEKNLWHQAMLRGQPPNCAHRHEGLVGELSSYAPYIGVEVICDELTNVCEGDYSILFIARKKAKNSENL